MALVRGLLLGAVFVLAQAGWAQGRVAEVQQGTNMTLDLAPDGETLVVSFLGRLWTLPAGGGGAMPLTPAGENARHPRFSPDGRRLVYQRLVEGQWELWLLDLETNDRAQLTGPPYDEREPDFSADGAAVIFASNRGGQSGLWRLDLTTHALTQLTMEAGEAFFPSVSERGEVVYVRRMGEQWSLRVLAPEGRSVELVRSANRLAAPVWRPGGGVVVYNEQNGAAASELMMLVMSNPPLVRPLTRGEDVFTSRPAWRSRAEYVYTADGQIWRRGLGNVARGTVPLFAAVPVDSSAPPSLVADLDAPGPHPVQGVASAAVSRDGQRTVFVALGDLWLLESGVPPRRLTDDPYVAVDPTFTANGEAIVFASDRVGTMDLWRLELEGGTLTRLTEGPARAHGPAVSPGGGRIAYLETDGLGPWSPSTLKLLYVDLASAVADTLVTDLLEPGRVVWSDDGARLTVEAARAGANGQVGRRGVLELDLSEWPPRLLDRLHADAPAAPPAPTIALEWDHARPPAPYAVQVGRLFDGIHGQYRRDVDIHVDGQRITAIVDRNAEPLPELVIDARDATVVPGLIDAHVHQSSIAGERLGRMWLAYGVTTVREVGGDLAEALERSEAWASGRRLGPRLVITPAPSAPAAELAGRLNGSPAAALLERHPALPDGLGHGLVRQARLLGVPQWQEPALLAKLVHRGVAGTLQSLEVSPLKMMYQDVVGTLTASGTVVTTALGALGGLQTLPEPWQALASGDRAYQRLFTPEERGRWSLLGEPEPSLHGLSRTVARLIRNGGRVVAGSDAPAVPYGLGLHAELALLATGGMARDQVLRAATSDGAVALGLGRQLGTLEAGKLADFVVLAGDPLERIEDTLTIVAVVKGGTWFDRERLLAGP